jgi:hypothetical protein
MPGRVHPRLGGRYALARHIIHEECVVLYARETRSPELTERFLTFCADPNGFLTAASLEALARLQPSSALLFDVCKRLLLVERPHFEARHSQLIAAQIIAKIFSARAESHHLLKTASAALYEYAGLMGLVIAWPTDRLITSTCERVLSTGRRVFSWPICAAVVAAAAQPEPFARMACGFMTRKRPGRWDFAEMTLESFQSRLERDAQTVDTLLEYAAETDDPNIRISVATLLSTYSGGDITKIRSRLREWAHQETARAGTPRFGLDISTNRRRPLLSVLNRLTSTP